MTAAQFAATDPSLPANVSAIGALIGIVWWLVRRADASDDRRNDEIGLLRNELSELRQQSAVDLAEANAKVDLQRDEKHRLINRVAAVSGALQMSRAAMESCTCGATAVVLPVVNQILDKETKSDE